MAPGLVPLKLPAPGHETVALLPLPLPPPKKDKPTLKVLKQHLRPFSLYPVTVQGKHLSWLLWVIFKTVLGSLHLRPHLKLAPLAASSSLKGQAGDRP